MTERLVTNEGREVNPKREILRKIFLAARGVDQALVTGHWGSLRRWRGGAKFRHFKISAFQLFGTTDRAAVFSAWLAELGGNRRLEDWQVRQAADAVRRAHAELLGEGWAEALAWNDVVAGVLAGRLGEPMDVPVDVETVVERVRAKTMDDGRRDFREIKKPPPEKLRPSRIRRAAEAVGPYRATHWNGKRRMSRIPHPATLFRFDFVPIRFCLLPFVGNGHKGKVTKRKPPRIRRLCPHSTLFQLDFVLFPLSRFPLSATGTKVGDKGKQTKIPPAPDKGTLPSRIYV